MIYCTKLLPSPLCYFARLFPSLAGLGERNMILAVLNTERAVGIVVFVYTGEEISFGLQNNSNNGFFFFIVI